MRSKRNAYIDLAKGICISIVMCFHLKEIIPNDCMLAPVAFSACMLPPFFFLSGLYFKEESSLSVFMQKKIDRLFIPFTVFYIITAVAVPNMLHFGFGMKFETVVGWPSLWAFVWPGKYPNIPIWFLWCLFIMSIIFRVLLSFSKAINEKQHQLILILLCISCAVIGISLEEYYQTDIANLFKALKSIPLFCLGYMMSHVDILSRITSMGIRKKLGGLFAAFSISLLSCLTCDNVWINEVLYYIAGTAGTALIIILSSIIVQMPLISYLGRYSIIVLLTHGLMVRAGFPLFQNIANTIPPYISVTAFWICMACSYFAIVPFCKRFLPYATAQRPLFYRQLNHEEGASSLNKVLP